MSTLSRKTESSLESRPAWAGQSGECAVAESGPGLPVQLASDWRFPILVGSDGRQLQYIHDEDFLLSAVASDLLVVPSTQVDAKRLPRAEVELGGLATLWSIPLLSRDDELHYFRVFHFLKFQSALLQRELTTCRGHANMVRGIELRLEAAKEMRNLLVESNLRLVVAIAKKYAPKSFASLDDLMSVGHTALIKAVEQFDYRRGFRFSTYAYQAIQRSIFGWFRGEAKHRERYAFDECESVKSLVKDAAGKEQAQAQAADAKAEIERLLVVLSPRQRLVVKARFGMEADSQPCSFQAIALRLGLSKQRVATIFSEAMFQLRRAFDPQQAKNWKTA